MYKRQGLEKAAAQAARKALEPFGNVDVDVLGNVVMQFGKQEADTQILLNAHIAVSYTHLLHYTTRQSVFDSSVGGKTMISYIVLYLSIVFLITSAAVLALQQLSEASDNIERYRLLRKLGTDSKMVYRSLFIQIAISFILPLILAMVHSCVAISVVGNTARCV